MTDNSQSQALHLTFTFKASSAPVKPKFLSGSATALYGASLVLAFTALTSPAALSDDISPNSTAPLSSHKDLAANIPWPQQPLTLDECLNLAMAQSPRLLKGKQDVEEAHGIALQHTSVYLPRLGATGAYNRIDDNKIERVAFAPDTPAVAFQNNQNWNAQITITQPIFTGGRMRSAARSAKLTREAALAGYHALVSDVLLEVRTTYQEVLFTAEQIAVQEASIQLLQSELQDTTRRFDAGTVPRFNVLRAEVELANGKPRLIRARNAHRIAKNSLATLLGFDTPSNVGQDLPIQIAGTLEAPPYEVDLADAIVRALNQRPELEALRSTEKLRSEEVRQNRAAYIPQLSAIAGYGWQNRNFVRDLSQELHGWNLGAQLSWDIWDGNLTRGRVQSAKAREEKARIEVVDAARQVELEVRIAHSSFIEAREVLESQQKVTEQGEEALRLAVARSDAGSGTQLDVLSAQTALTEARTTYSEALRDYSVALARLERAMGEGVRLQESP